MLVNLFSATLSAIPWDEGDGGKVSWSVNCEFWSSTDIVDKILNAETCGLECYNNAQCTHFTHKNGHCYLRKIESSEGSPVKSPGSMCGFIRSRVPQPWPTSYDFLSAMNCLCKPKGTHSDVQTLRLENDGSIVQLNWRNDGEGGQISWAEYCDVSGFDLKFGETKPASKENCQKDCLDNSECNNFTYNQDTGTCYLKSIPPEVVNPPMFGYREAFCGYVRSRYSPPSFRTESVADWHCVCRPTDI